MYNDVDEKYMSLLQIRALKTNFKYVDNVTFNESIECDDIRIYFKKNFKNHGFFIGFVAEIISRKKLNRTVLYYGGGVEDLSLKAIQTLSCYYPLSPDYPIREDFSDILSLKYL